MKLILTIIILLSGSILADINQADTLNSTLIINAVRLNEQVKIDGILSESVWNNGSGVTKFYQRDPSEGSSPTEKTEIFVAYDDEALYVAAKLYDSKPDSIVSRLGRRDNYVSSDQFVFFLLTLIAISKPDTFLACTFQVQYSTGYYIMIVGKIIPGMAFGKVKQLL